MKFNLNGTLFLKHLSSSEYLNTTERESLCVQRDIIHNYNFLTKLLCTIHFHEFPNLSINR